MKARKLWLILLLLFALALAACGGDDEEAVESEVEAPAETETESEEPFKVAFVYVAPIGDLGWTYAHDEGRLLLEEEFGDGIETVFVENIPEGPDAERVIRDFAQKGYDLIITTSPWRKNSQMLNSYIFLATKVRIICQIFSAECTSPATYQAWLPGRRLRAISLVTSQLFQSLRLSGASTPLPWVFAK